MAAVQPIPVTRADAEDCTSSGTLFPTLFSECAVEERAARRVFSEFWRFVSLNRSAASRMNAGLGCFRLL